MHSIRMWFVLGLISSALAIDRTSNPELVADLKMAATQLDRLDLLPEDSAWLFDFKAQSGYTFSPGSVINANAATFPASVGNGLTMAMLNLGPCAMLPPHFHARAANFVVAVSGTTTTYMLEENGARLINHTLTPGKMTIFPQGSLHAMQNNECEDAVLISALNSEDTGTLNVANGLFSLPQDMVFAAFGYNSDMWNISDLAASIPPVGTGSVLGSAECLATCLAKKNFHP